MYVNTNSCRICGNDIPEDRKQSGIYICTCGHVENGHVGTTLDKAASRMIANFGILVTGIALPAVLFLGSWSGFGMEMFGIYAKSTFGSLSATDLLRKAEICEQLRKNECAAESYGSVIRQYPKEEQAYLRLAHMYLRVQDKAGAIQVYQAFFKNGGQDPNLKFRMANLLVEIGQTELAAQTYQELMSSEPGILHITVAKTYVQLLIKLGQFDNAKSVITQFQNQGDNAKEYLNEELLQIEAGLKGQKGQTSKI